MPLFLYSLRKVIIKEIIDSKTHLDFFSSKLIVWTVLIRIQLWQISGSGSIYNVFGSTTLVMHIRRPCDICVSAPTGSGKTLAFVLPIIQSLKTRVVPRVRALAVLPTQVPQVQSFCTVFSWGRGRMFFFRTPANKGDTITSIFTSWSLSGVKINQLYTLGRRLSNSF